MRCFLLMFGVAILPFLWSAAHGQSPASSSTDKPFKDAEERVSASSAQLSILKQRGGERVLKIDYPWQIYKKPSIEIWLFTNDNNANTRPRPVYFVDHQLKGDTRIKVGQCFEAAFGVGVKRSITLGPRTFDLVGRRNWLGKPSVSIVLTKKRDLQEEKKKKLSDQADPDAQDDEVPEKFSDYGVWVGYCDLENWSANRHELFLDLSPDNFTLPGKLYIWFLRGDTIVWEQCLDWKGY